MFLMWEEKNCRKLNINMSNVYIIALWALGRPNNLFCRPLLKDKAGNVLFLTVSKDQNQQHITLSLST